MNPATQHDPASLPNAEWHGGVAEHGQEARGVNQRVQTLSPSLTLRARKSTARSVLIWLALWSLLLLPTWNGFVPVADDLGAYHLPLRAYYQSALQAGENWTWCPWIFGGYHLHGEGQIGGDHPLHQLLYRVLPLHWAFGIECWWAYPATFFGMWWWLRQLRFSTTASQVAALAFSLCGFMTLRVVHTNAVQVIAHLPWLLGCLTWLEHRARRSTSLGSLLPPIACSALLTGSQLLLGYPQYVVFTLLAESLWLGSLMIRSPHERRTLAIAWITAKAIGLLLGASQVLPTLEYLSLSERMDWTSEQMFEGSWPLLNLTQLIAPYLFTNRVVGQNTHELTIFMGIVPVCLGVLGLVNRPRPSLRAVKGFAVALCAVSLLLALGDMSPIAELMPYIPVWNRFRFPCRATLLLCLGIALLAALGCQRIVELAKRPKTTIATLSSTIRFTWTERRWWHGLFMISVLVPIYVAIAWSNYLNSWPFMLAGPACILLTLMLLYFMSIQQKAQDFLPFVIALELLIYAGSHSHWQQFEDTEWYAKSKPEPFVQASAYMQTRYLPLTEFRSNNNLAPNLLTGPKGLLNGHQGICYQLPMAQIHGYAGVQPQRRLIYDLDHPGALLAAGVTAGFSQKNHKERIYGQTLDLYSLNRVQLIAETRISANPASEIEIIDPLKLALVESDQNLPAPTPKDHLQIQLTADRPGHLAMALETNRDALLVTTESFHPGWHAQVDGAEVPVLRVNGDFLGVRVGAAAQRVESYFSDNWHAVGRWISLGSLGLLGLVFCLMRLRQNALGFVR